MAPLEWRTCIAAFSRISLFNLIFVVTGWQPPSRRVGPEKRLKMLVTKVVVVASMDENETWTPVGEKVPHHCSS